jgi:predicted alpha/beta hydrolase family esterase
MKKQVLLVQGGSKGAYEADRKLAESLRKELGPGYQVRYPEMPNEDEPDYQTWRAVILKEADDLGRGAILVGHSIGSSVLIKLMTDGGPTPSTAGLFLASAPFWHDDDFWSWDEVALSGDAGRRYPSGVPLFFYRGEADDFIPKSHLDMYAKAFPQAVIRQVSGDHQLGENMAPIARDIEQLR